MADTYDPLPDLARVLASVLADPIRVNVHADRIAEQLGLGEDDSAEMVATELRKALGVPGPRTVTYDTSAVDSYSVLTAALDEFAAEQRYRARGEGGNLRRDEWAGKADEMRRQAEAAWEARDDG